MSEYKIPEEYYFRIHHVRPRFKGDIENVLVYVADKITRIGECSRDEFISKLNEALFAYPGNANRELKTINNWRTEISALFGFIIHTEKTDKPGLRAIELSNHQDLIECFKTFLYNFQYPGAHIKPHEVLLQIEAGVKFKPAQYILKLFKHASEVEHANVGFTKAEICHCVFNDLRVIRDNEDVGTTWNRIKENRQQHLTYDQTGDVIRYAGDIIDYMEIANLLKTYDSRTYYLNTLEEESIIKFCNSKEWFSGYDCMIQNMSGSLESIKNQSDNWFNYVNRSMSDTDFSTDILKFIATDEKELSQLKLSSFAALDERSDEEKRDDELTGRIQFEIEEFTTKDIGDIGEGLVHGHECMRIKKLGREDLIHLIKRIPTQFAVGYDISSVEADERKRYIEVKTTISSKPLHFNRVHLTKNEWNTANSTHDRYFVYRLMLSKTERRLFILQDPVGLYKKDLINMIPDDGAEITFNPEQVGQYEELLTWQS